MTANEFVILQRARAEEYAPPDSIDEAEFVGRASHYSLPTLRQAAVRYNTARGRNYGLVMERFLEALRNPHINQGDDYRLALGHIEATRRWMEANGL